jgi:hypothetical protein
MGKRVDRMPWLNGNTKDSLSRRILVRLGMIIALTMIVTTLTIYQWTSSMFTEQTTEQLEKYILERGQGEAILFSTLEQDLSYFKQEFLNRYEKMGNADPQEWFDEWFTEEADGTVRMLPDAFHGFERQNTGIAQGVTVYVGGNAEITAEFRRARRFF